MELKSYVGIVGVRRERRMSNLKIAIISTSLISTPPHLNYGGAERVTYDLAEALSQRGNEVTLFATKNSQAPSKGKLVEIGEENIEGNISWIHAEYASWMKYRGRLINAFDVVLGSNWCGMEYLSKLLLPSTRVCHLHHGFLNVQWWCNGGNPFPLNMIMPSKYMASMTEKNAKVKCKSIYHGIDLSLYPYQKEKQERFLFVGRIHPIKAPHLAIEAAQKANVGLDIVGSTSYLPNTEYIDLIKSKCDGKQIRFIGEVNQEDKVKYMQNARGLLVTSRFGEPFGLMAVEAQACGTPVVTINDGALGELISPELSGFVCNNMNEMVDAIGSIDVITPEYCRKRAEFFDRNRMAASYEALFKKMIEGEEW